MNVIPLSEIEQHWELSALIIDLLYLERRMLLAKHLERSFYPCEIAELHEIMIYEIYISTINWKYL